MELTVLVWKEDKWYIAFDPVTGIASQGRSVGEALDNLREALELYFEEEEVPETYILEDARTVTINTKTTPV